MTHLFYSLDEAARELDISETVLVRLSQTLRVPEAAYEDTGYLSFKGDLNFSDHDISFFRQVKQRLLAGETLEDVKRRAHRPENVTPPAPAPAQPRHLQEVVQTDPGDVETLADRNFERYKHQNRGGTLKVFKKMLDEVAGDAQKTGPQKPAPQPTLSAKPLKPRADEDRPEKRILPRIEPFTRQPELQELAATRIAPQAPPAESAAEIDDFYPAASEDETPRRYRDKEYSHHNPMPQLPKLPGIGGLFGGEKPKKEAAAPRKPQFDELPVEDFEHFDGFEEMAPEKPAKNPVYASQPQTPEFTGFKSPWENLIRESAKDPRDLSIHLKTAAQVLREKALKQGKTPASGTHAGQKVTFS